MDLLTLLTRLFTTGDTKLATSELADQIPILEEYRLDHDSKAYGLFVDAAQAHEEGDHKSASKLVQEAIASCRQANELVPIDYLLRLPTYLVALNRKQDAWKYYRQILTDCVSHDKNIKPMLLSIVYDKMRLFQQRQGDYNAALVYSALSYLSWQKGLILQDRLTEYAEQSLPDYIQNSLRLVYDKADDEVRKAIYGYIKKVRIKIATLDFEQTEAELLSLI